MPEISAEPVVGLIRPTAALHERRLAGAVRPEQADELSFRDVEVDGDECLDAAVPLAEAARGEGRRHAWSLGRAAARLAR